MKNNYIPGIYNYCDRWCKKCRFTAKCRNYASLPGLSEGDIDVNNEDFWQEINANFQQAIELIKTWVEEQGLDWESFEKEIKEQELITPQLSKEQVYLKSLSNKYIEKLQTWFAKNKNFLENKEQEVNIQLSLGVNSTMERAIQVKDAIEIINWYMTFIGAKIARAIDISHDDWAIKEYPIQNDANGSAKIALIAIKRSLAAWETIRSYFPEKTDELIDILILLDKMRKNLHAQFPNLEQFIRPGFDTPS